MQPLLIAGAGGFGRETAEAVGALNLEEARWELLGFLDDDPALQGRSVGDLPVLGPCELIHEHRQAALVVTVGSPANRGVRRAVVERLGLPAERYATIVHPAASLGGSVRVGAGSVVLAGTVATADVSIGSHVAVMPHVTLTHDDVIGDFASLASGVALAGTVSVGEGAYLGGGVLVRENLSVGAGALVGMGSLVLEDVPAGETWVGAPARPLTRTASR